MEHSLLITLIILTLILWFWAIIDISRSRFKRTYLQVLAFLMIFLFPIVGTILYFQFKRKFTKRNRRQFLKQMKSGKKGN